MADPKAGGDLEQIHCCWATLRSRTTERYLGTEQELTVASMTGAGDGVSKRRPFRSSELSHEVQLHPRYLRCSVQFTKPALIYIDLAQPNGAASSQGPLAQMRQVFL
jgi:hypothetical protein